MKKNLKKIIGCVVILTIILSSCQIEKRHYTSGYNVKWIGSNHSIVKNNLSKPTTVSRINPVKTIEPSYSNSSNQTRDEISSTRTKVLNQQPTDQNNLTATIDNKTPLNFEKYVYNDNSENLSTEKSALKSAKSIVMKKSSEVSGDNYYFRKWIISLVISLILFLLAGLFATTLAIGLAYILWIAGIIFLIIALVYFIRWIETV